MVFHKERKNLKIIKLVFVHLKKDSLRAKKFRLTLNSKLLFLLLRVDIPNMVKSGTLNML